MIRLQQFLQLPVSFWHSVLRSVGALKAQPSYTFKPGKTRPGHETLEMKGKWRKFRDLVFHLHESFLSCLLALPFHHVKSWKHHQIWLEFIQAGHKHFQHVQGAVGQVVGEDEAVGSGCPHSAPLLTWGGANRTKCVWTGLFLGKITNSKGSISSKKSHGTVLAITWRSPWVSSARG